MDDVIQIISTVGFPIFSALAVGFFCKYLVDKYTGIITTTLNQLTDAIEDLRTELKTIQSRKDI